MLRDYNYYVVSINGETTFPTMLPAMVSTARKAHQYHYDEHFSSRSPYYLSDPHTLTFRRGVETTFPVFLPTWFKMHRERQFSGPPSFRDANPE